MDSSSGPGSSPLFNTFFRLDTTLSKAKGRKPDQTKSLNLYLRIVDKEEKPENEIGVEFAKKTVWTRLRDLFVSKEKKIDRLKTGLDKVKQALEEGFRELLFTLTTTDQEEAEAALKDVGIISKFEHHFSDDFFSRIENKHGLPDAPMGRLKELAKGFIELKSLDAGLKKEVDQQQTITQIYMCLKGGFEAKRKEDAKTQKKEEALNALRGQLKTAIGGAGKLLENTLAMANIDGLDTQKASLSRLQGQLSGIRKTKRSTIDDTEQAIEQVEQLTQDVELLQGEIGEVKKWREVLEELDRRAEDLGVFVKVKDRPLPTDSASLREYVTDRSKAMNDLAVLIKEANSIGFLMPPSIDLNKGTLTTLKGDFEEFSRCQRERHSLVRDAEQGIKVAEENIELGKSVLDEFPASLKALQGRVDEVRREVGQCGKQVVHIVEKAQSSLAEAKTLYAKVVDLQKESAEYVEKAVEEKQRPADETKGKIEREIADLAQRLGDEAAVSNELLEPVQQRNNLEMALKTALSELEGRGVYLKARGDTLNLGEEFPEIKEEDTLEETRKAFNEYELLLDLIEAQEESEVKGKEERVEFKSELEKEDVASQIGVGSTMDDASISRETGTSLQDDLEGLFGADLSVRRKEPSDEEPSDEESSSERELTSIEIGVRSVALGEKQGLLEEVDKKIKELKGKIAPFEAVLEEISNGNGSSRDEALGLLLAEQIASLEGRIEASKSALDRPEETLSLLAEVAKGVEEFDGKVSQNIADQIKFFDPTNKLTKFWTDFRNAPLGEKRDVLRKAEATWLEKRFKEVSREYEKQKDSIEELEEDVEQIPAGELSKAFEEIKKDHEVIGRSLLDVKKEEKMKGFSGHRTYDRTIAEFEKSTKRLGERIRTFCDELFDIMDSIETEAEKKQTELSRRASPLGLLVPKMFEDENVFEYKERVDAFEQEIISLEKDKAFAEDVIKTIETNIGKIKASDWIKQDILRRLKERKDEMHLLSLGSRGYRRALRNLTSYFSEEGINAQVTELKEGERVLREDIRKKAEEVEQYREYVRAERDILADFGPKELEEVITTLGKVRLELSEGLPLEEQRDFLNKAWAAFRSTKTNADEIVADARYKASTETSKELEETEGTARGLGVSTDAFEALKVLVLESPEKVRPILLQVNELLAAQQDLIRTRDIDSEALKTALSEETSTILGDVVNRLLEEKEVGDIKTQAQRRWDGAIGVLRDKAKVPTKKELREMTELALHDIENYSRIIRGGLLDDFTETIKQKCPEEFRLIQTILEELSLTRETLETSPAQPGPGAHIRTDLPVVRGLIEEQFQQYKNCLHKMADIILNKLVPLLRQIGLTEERIDGLSEALKQSVDEDDVDGMHKALRAPLQLLKDPASLLELKLDDECAVLEKTAEKGVAASVISYLTEGLREKTIELREAFLKEGAGLEGMKGWIAQRIKDEVIEPWGKVVEKYRAVRERLSEKDQLTLDQELIEIFGKGGESAIEEATQRLGEVVKDKEGEVLQQIMTKAGELGVVESTLNELKQYVGQRGGEMLPILQTMDTMLIDQAAISEMEKFALNLKKAFSDAAGAIVSGVVDGLARKKEIDNIEETAERRSTLFEKYRTVHRFIEARGVVGGMTSLMLKNAFIDALRHREIDKAYDVIDSMYQSFLGYPSGEKEIEEATKRLGEVKGEEVEVLGKIITKAKELGVAEITLRELKQCVQQRAGRMLSILRTMDTMLIDQADIQANISGTSRSDNDFKEALSAEAVDILNGVVDGLVQGKRIGDIKKRVERTSALFKKYQTIQRFYKGKGEVLWTVRLGDLTKAFRERLVHHEIDMTYDPIDSIYQEVLRQQGSVQE